MGFDVTIRNSNNRQIRCLNTKFTAFMAPIGDRCQTSDYNSLIDINDGQGALEIPANGEFTKKHIGNREREKRSLQLGRDLEFCRRDNFNLQCGYDCSESHKFNEDWDEELTGGGRRRHCESNGVAITIPGTFSCKPGYDRDETREQCIPRLCDNRYSVGSFVSFDFLDGARNNVTSGTYKAECLVSGFFGNPVPGSVSCTIDYYLNESGSSCIHKSSRSSWSLSNNILGCSESGAANSQECRTGTVRWCSANGYGGSGLAQEFGEGGFAALCFSPDHVDLINRSDIPYFGNYALNDGYFRTGLVEFCLKRYGIGFGLVHEAGANGALIVSCSQSTIFHIDNSNRNDREMIEIGALLQVGGCLGLAFDETSTACHALAHRFCTGKGYVGGYISGRYSTIGTDIQCISSGYYKGIDY
ncbi:MAG: hypothetical protein NTX25_07955 [Proteobacteria bacterium]|nr:hypothetical protein [Pseudomonadota bacterium]